ncbi:MAG: hypothetical protein KGL39_22925 [Patescibacteria group bacterium]|nr:hypothetical protein [Patescibacteria group bacterium]
MKTCTFQEIVNLAMEYAMRTRDKLLSKEQLMLQGFLATEFEILFNGQPWEFLIPDFVQFNVANNQVALDEDLYGDVLAVTSLNPHVSDYYWHIPYSFGTDANADRILWTGEPADTIWLEAMQPYPGTVWPDLAAMSLADFYAAKCPRVWKAVLARKAAAEMLAQDDNAAAAGVQLGLADRALAAVIQRFCPVPAWRGFRMSPPTDRRKGSPSYV